MKRIVPIALFVTLLAVSCEKAIVAIPEETQTSETQIPETNTSPGWHKVTISAGIDETATKTAYSEDRYFSWTTGDKISVLMNNGSANEFFTFTATESGSKTSNFEADVLDGYDYFGSVEDGTKWALYPASDEHVFNNDWTNVKCYKICFDLPSEIDLSTNFSVNIPMYALGDGSNDYTFSPITHAFKFTFKVAAGINKVKLTLNQASGYYLSGKSPIRTDSGTFLACEPRSDNGSSVGLCNRELSIIRTVETVGSDRLATFYVPYRIYQSFTPSITLYNMDNGYTLLEADFVWKDRNDDGLVDDKDALKAGDQSSITIMPLADVTAKGLGSPTSPYKFGIDWDTIDMYPDDPAKEAYPSATSRILDWKVTADATYVYFLYRMSKTGEKAYSEGYIITGFNNDNAATGGTNYGQTGLEYYSLTYPFTNASVGSPTFVAGNISSYKIYPYDSAGTRGSSTGNIPDTYGFVNGDDAIIEYRVARSHIGSPSGTITVDNSCGSEHTGSQTITLP